jgi:replicative superfamily II helicase
VVVSAPTGSGKTVLMELALIREWGLSNITKAVYLAPTKALCSERAKDWSTKFTQLGFRVAEITGDSDFASIREARSGHVIVTTPEKWDSMTRKWRENRDFISSITLFMIDEVQMLSDRRGSTLEAAVSRMKTVSIETARRIRYLALSATFPNVVDVGEWLFNAHVFCFGEEYRPVRLTRLVVGSQSLAIREDAWVSHYVDFTWKCRREQW